MVCLYILFIWVVVLAKVFKGFRFDVHLYSDFKGVASAVGVL